MASSRRTGTNESRWTGSAWEAGVNTFGAAGFGRDYTSLTTWEADTDVDIVTATVNPVLECYADLGFYPLTGGPTFSGTTSSTTYFRILRAAASARHDGVSGGGVVFNMVGTGTLGFNVGEIGFKLQDVECRHATNNAGDASAITGTQQAGIEVIGCIAKCTNAGAGAGNGIIFANSQNYRVVNCVAFECKTNGISIRGANARILNCTSVSNGGVGFTFVTDASVVIGCIAQDNTGGDFAASFASGSNYNLSKDTSAPGANSVISTDLTFRGASSDDYRLAAADTAAVGAGSDLSAYSDFAFDDDIAFTARGGTWDIGAHEYVTVATVTAAEDVIAFNIGTGAAGTTVTVNHNLGTTPAFGILFWSGRTESTSTAGGATFNRGMGWFKSMGGSPTDFYAVGSRDQDAAGSAICDSGQRVDACIFEMGDGAAVGWADVQSVTATQITFEILDAFVTDLRVTCKLWGGTDFTKCAMGIITPTGAAPVTQEVATSDGGAFQADIVFFLSAMIANDASAIAVDSSIMFGAMRTASEEYVFLGGGNNAQNNMQTKSYSNPNECIAQFGTDPTASPVNRAEFSAIGSGSFTLNWLERGNASRVFWMAVKGGSWKVSNLVTRTDTTTQFSVTTSFPPKGGLCIGHCKAESTQDDPPLANDEWSMGAFTSASKRYAQFVGSRDGIGTSQVMTAYRTDAVYVNMDVTTDAVEGLMDVHSMNSDGVTFIMDDADPAILSFVGVILSGGTVVAGLTSSVFDAISTSDVVKAVITPLVVRSIESVTATDALFKIVLSPLLVRSFETVTAADVAKAVVTPLVVRSFESVASADVIKAVVTPIIVRAFEGVTVAEFLRLILDPLVVRAEDSITSADVAKVVLSPALLQVFESITVAELTNAAVSPLTVRAEEAITALDAVKAAVTPLVVRADDVIAVIEAIQAELRLAALKVDTFDAVTVADAAKAVLPQLVARLFETLAVAEFTNPILTPLLAALFETISTVDVAKPILTPLIIRVAEAISATEGLKSPLDPLIARVAELLTVLDEVRAVLPQLAAHPTDVISVLDALDVELKAVGGMVRSVFDTVTVSESVSLLLNPLVARVFDAVSVVEEVLLTLNVPEIRLRVHEAITVTENLKVVLDVLTVRAHELVAVEDFVKAAFDQYLARPFESVTVAEFLRVVLPQLAVHAQDSVAVADVIKAVTTPSVLRAAEQITVGDFLAAVLTQVTTNVQRFETITVVDLVMAAVTPLTVRAVDAVAILDAVAAAVTPLFARPFETITVVEFVAVTLPESGVLSRLVFETITVADAVSLAFTAVVHFVVAELRASGSISNLQGRLSVPAGSPAEGTLSGELGGGTITRLED